MQTEHDKNRKPDNDPSLPATFDPRPPRLGKPPFWMVVGPLILVIASWIPLALAYKSRASLSPVPRIQLVQDMGTSRSTASSRPATSSPTAGRCGRGSRAPSPGASSTRTTTTTAGSPARKPSEPGGKAEVVWFEEFPAQVKLTPEFIDRGQQRFNIYCSACHGLDGQGHGPVNDRALELQAGGQDQTVWTQAANLVSDPIRACAAGHIYNTINVGIRNMPAYGPQIPPEDRWAIVAYVRALQLSQNAPADAIDKPAERVKAVGKAAAESLGKGIADGDLGIPPSAYGVMTAP